MIPLERNTVRFVDHFSAGTRGSVSAEYFLEQGYAVSSRSIHAWSDVSREREREREASRKRQNIRKFRWTE